MQNEKEKSSNEEKSSIKEKSSNEEQSSNEEKSSSREKTSNEEKSSNEEWEGVTMNKSDCNNFWHIFTAVHNRAVILEATKKLNLRAP